MRQLGKIICREINNNDDAPWVIFFHGFGADMNDLQSLGEMISTHKTYNWLFPNGPLDVPHSVGGKAWWHIDMMELQRIMMTGGERDQSLSTPAGLDKSVDMTMEMIRQLRVPWNKIILGGFSQGAMLATELYLKAPETPKGLVIMSGTLLHQDKWKELIPARAGQKFFQSHGTHDPVLSHKQAARLETLLTQNGMKGHLMSFAGGHEIPMPVLKKISEYINSLD